MKSCSWSRFRLCQEVILRRRPAEFSASVKSIITSQWSQINGVSVLTMFLWEVNSIGGLDSLEQPRSRSRFFDTSKKTFLKFLNFLDCQDRHQNYIEIEIMSRKLRPPNTVLLRLNRPGKSKEKLSKKYNDRRLEQVLRSTGSSSTIQNWLTSTTRRSRFWEKKVHNLT